MPITVQDLLEAGCHFGHQTKRWNPKMKEFVYGAKNGISIIDITKTIHQIGDACNFLQSLVMRGGEILFVGTKRQAQQIVKECAETAGMSYVAERWMGGILTNNVTIRNSVKKMREIDGIINGEAAASLKKKEVVNLSRLSVKFHRDLDGIKDMKRLPDALVIIDVCHDQNAVKEAKKLNIPIVAIVDTNGNPEPIDYPVAANDDAVKSIKIIMDTFMEAIKDALVIFEKRSAEDKAKLEAAKAEKEEGETKRRASDKKPARKPVRRGPRKTADGELAAKMGEDEKPADEAKKPARKPAAKKAAPKADAEKAAKAEKAE